MLYVSTSEVFDNTYPGTIQDRQEIVNTTADRETIKKVIGENVYIQAALVKETDFVIESVRRDKKLKPERCGTNCMFFWTAMKAGFFPTYLLYTADLNR